MDKIKKAIEAGGIMCLPLDKNLNGDIAAKHPDWELLRCPQCGQKCWKHPEASRMARDFGVRFLCTECAIKEGLVSPFHRTAPQLPVGGNRAQRRKAKRRKE